LSAYIILKNYRQSI